MLKAVISKKMQYFILFVICCAAVRAFTCYLKLFLETKSCSKITTEAFGNLCNNGNRVTELKVADRFQTVGVKLDLWLFILNFNIMSEIYLLMCWIQRMVNTRRDWSLGERAARGD